MATEPTEEHGKITIAACRDRTCREMDYRQSYCCLIVAVMTTLETYKELPEQRGIKRDLCKLYLHKSFHLSVFFRGFRGY